MTLLLLAHYQFMRTYELTAVFAGTISDTDVAAACDRVQKIITDAGAASVTRAELGKHKLSYPINKNTYGMFVVFTLECEDAASHAIQQKLRLSKDVIRFVVEIHVPARLKRTPQIADNPLIKASREKEREERMEREDRGERGSGPQHFASAREAAPEIQKMEEPVAAVDMAEIDKKLDQLLQGDLTPAV
jgi:ribosomal protein S6